MFLSLSSEVSIGTFKDSGRLVLKDFSSVWSIWALCTANIMEDSLAWRGNQEKGRNEKSWRWLGSRSSNFYANDQVPFQCLLLVAFTYVLTSSKEGRDWQKAQGALSEHFNSLPYTSRNSGCYFHLRLTNMFKIYIYTVFWNLVAISDSSESTSNNPCNLGKGTQPLWALGSSEVDGIIALCNS